MHRLVLIPIFVLLSAVADNVYIPFISSPNEIHSTPAITPTSPGGTLEATPTPSRTPFSTFTPSPTFTPTHTPTVTETPTETSTPTITPTPTSTNTPTVTPTPADTATSTPSPTLTASPTYTPTPGTMTVLGNHRAFVSGTGSLYIVGEVRNGTSNRARFVKVTANLFSNQGQLVDTDYSFISLDVLPPSETTCFKIIFFGGSAPYSYYTFETSYSETINTSLPIAVFGDSGSYNPTFTDWYEIVGQARNDSGVNVRFVKIIGTIYGNSGEVLDCDYAFTNADVLTPGQVSTWKITSLQTTNGAVGNYRLQAQGMEE